MEYVWMAMLVIATVVVIAIPVVKADDSGELPAEIDQTLAKLEEEKESAYNAIKEAEFDYETSKLSDEDYKSIKDKYSAKAMEALQKLEEHEKEASERELDTKATSGHIKQQKFCGSCGAQLPNDAKFCGECGGKVT